MLTSSYHYDNYNYHSTPTKPRLASVSSTVRLE